ncbi:MAG TPA: response regulator transcription factor [Actinomycetota bacterium]|nr:response regulator transcription factor [Actinomycetota bacterium]
MPDPDTDTAPRLRVLVVDDCPQLRRHVREALEDAGVVVVGEAADGVQALSEAAARRPDVVLMDLRMPRMGGVEAALTLRRRQPEMRVVLWTGEDDERLASAVRRSGADAGLAKGVRINELVATLRAVCAAQPIHASR